MAWSCHENEWSTHSEASAALRNCGIQEKTWQTRMEKCGKEGPPKNGINLERDWSISSRQTFVASTCGPMHRWCWMKLKSQCTGIAKQFQTNVFCVSRMRNIKHLRKTGWTYEILGWPHAVENRRWTSASKIDFDFRRRLERVLLRDRFSEARDRQKQSSLVEVNCFRLACL